MVEAAIIPDREKAHEIVGYMHSALQRHGVTPCHIAIFGSFLHGNNHAESDLDMIIISEKFEGKNLDERITMTMNAEDEVMDKYIVPMDVLLKTPQEYHNHKYFESKIIV